MAAVILKPGREKSLARRHPWIFSGAVERVEGECRPGETVTIHAAQGGLLARGAFSPHSQIRVRVWSFDATATIDPDFFKARLDRALALRRYLSAREPLDACRLVNAEADGLPGVIVDRYGDFLACQFLSAGAEFWKDTILDALRTLIPAAGIYERSDADVRTKEGLTPCRGLLAGREPPELVEIREGTFRFLVDIRQGHKTGFYLDQRQNRALSAGFAPGAEVLNCFAYTGAFGVYTLGSGAAALTNVESSAAALALSRRNLALNGLDLGRVEQVEGDVFQTLRLYRDTGRRFDLIVLDPPKFADSRRNLPRASRGYKDINLLAFKLLRPGGVLFTFSCSGLMPPDLFQKIVADAALDAGCHAQVLGRLDQSADHVTSLNFPEGRYLKGLICR